MHLGRVHPRAQGVMMADMADGAGKDGTKLGSSEKQPLSTGRVKMIEWDSPPTETDSLIVPTAF